MADLLELPGYNNSQVTACQYGLAYAIKRAGTLAETGYAHPEGYIGNIEGYRRVVAQLAPGWEDSWPFTHWGLIQA
jgi:hypothetical protein